MGFEYFITNRLTGIMLTPSYLPRVLSISLSTNDLLLGLRRAIFHEVWVLYYQQTTTQYAGFAQLNP